VRNLFSIPLVGRGNQNNCLPRSIEEILLIPEIKLEILLSKSDKLPIICLLDWQPFIEKYRKRLEGWQALSPHLWSSYQRPYFFAQSNAQRKIASRQQEKLGRILKGFSFRQLAALFNQDELELAKKLHPLITDGTILLREPYPPFDKLPKIVNHSTIPKNTTNLTNGKNANLQGQSVLPPNENQTKTVLPTISNNLVREKTWKIACIDDSPAILQKIEQFLENDAFSIFLIEDPIKALIQILKIQPDLILLDIGMPNVDGYQLCSLIRNHSLFKMTPIVMVTGKEGFIDRAKAKLAGATDYVTKPFSQAELIQIVFRYLT
jgi:twitching motility two-component system response regulator PilG